MFDSDEEWRIRLRLPRITKDDMDVSTFLGRRKTSIPWPGIAHWIVRTHVECAMELVDCSNINEVTRERYGHSVVDLVTLFMLVSKPVTSENVVDRIQRFPSQLTIELGAKLMRVFVDGDDDNNRLAWEAFEAWNNIRAEIVRAKSEIRK